MPLGTINILGVNVSATNLTDASLQIESWITARQKTYICVTGVHGIMEATRDATLQSIHNQAGLVVPDGMPLVYLSRLAGFQQSGRVYGPDLLAALCRSSLTSGRHHFFYGTTPDTLSKLTQRLSEAYPGLKIAGSYSPPFRPLTPEEGETIASYINDLNPDIVWVGLSTPKQERWMSVQRPRLQAPILVGVGAAFDFHAGTVRQSPLWLQPLCLEWLFRLLVEPKRLARRYLRNNPSFLGLVCRQWFSRKDRPRVQYRDALVSPVVSSADTVSQE